MDRRAERKSSFVSQNNFDLLGKHTLKLNPNRPYRTLIYLAFSIMAPNFLILLAYIF